METLIILHFILILNFTFSSAQRLRQRQRQTYLPYRQRQSTVTPPPSASSGSCELLNEPGKEYFLDKETNNCFQSGTRGPCGEFMIFYKPLINSSPYGFCDCDTGYESELPCKDNPIRRRVYVHKHKRCFSVFSQGPCKTGEWFILDEAQDSGVCVRNKCKSMSRPIGNSASDQFWFYDPQRHKCFQSLTQGYCSDGKTLELVHESQYPQCQTKQCYSSLVYGFARSTSCKSGSRFSFLTNSCRRTFTTLFGIG